MRPLSPDPVPFDPVADGVDLSVHIRGLKLNSPVMPASGCFGPELGRMLPMPEIGVAVTKTVFLQPRAGNPAHRLTEIPAGVVNSVGIPSRGPRGFLAGQFAAYQALSVPTIISIGGHSPAEYEEVATRLDGAGAGYEINVSCPNLDADGRDIGSDPAALHDTVSRVRAVTDKPLIAKLPVMVASIAECALAAQEAGADAVCIANSVPALPLEPGSLKPALGNYVGGLTGPHIRPIVLRLVWLAAKAVELPVIACGGIATADHALEYLSVGASAVQVGTANFSRPFAMVDVVRGLRSRCHAAGVTTITSLLRRETTLA
ncbi:dihydroorotate dehydrogenase [Micromonospora sp. NPDC048830]|uniref:dihydroorotate dehydrogenase n=1 Tax=Micromonospora sp. NPDC048830 TaxID=3364257 RepID=UPI003719076C